MIVTGEDRLSASGLDGRQHVVIIGGNHYGIGDVKRGDTLPDTHDEGLAAQQPEGLVA